MVTLCRHQQDSCWHLAATFGQRHADCVMLIYLQIFLLQGLTRKSHRLPSAPPLKEMGPTGLPPHATFTVIHDSRCKGYFFFQVFAQHRNTVQKSSFSKAPLSCHFQLQCWFCSLILGCSPLCTASVPKQIAQSCAAHLGSSADENRG